MSPAQYIAHYRILSKLGEGGMGAVYRASDTKLNRDVAIKVLPDALANDPAYLARFRREAQVLASLSHPNIAIIHGVEDNAIVMELVDGPTLEEKIAARSMTLDEVLAIARQIALALEAAHERGIIHRDLKPANVKVTPEGVVKVLDSGLAKPAEPIAGAGAANAPTITMHSTQLGVIMGTPGYMAPEQAAGKEVDKRADIWSFGVLLYEMLSGKRLFEGETLAHTLAHVLTRELDLDDVERGLRPLVARCLRRDPMKRLRDIGDARIAIDEYLAEPKPAAATPVVPRERRTRLMIAVAVALITAIVSWMAFSANRASTVPPLVRVNVEISPDMPFHTQSPGMFASLSPDGKRLAVALRGADGKQRIYTRLLSQDALTPLAGTENGAQPFFSPDGNWIGYTGDRKLKKISLEGGGPLVLCDAPSLHGASWGDDGNIVLAADANAGLVRVPSGGGNPDMVTRLNPEDRTHRWPHVLPGGEAAVFSSRVGAGNLGGNQIEWVSFKTGNRKVLQRDAFSAAYLPAGKNKGHLVYLRGSTLFAAPFDPVGGMITGTPVPVLQDVSSSRTRGGDFAFSSSGIFVYLRGAADQQKSPISSRNRSGTETVVYDTPGEYQTPRFSPNGKRLAFAAVSPQGSDIWVKDLDREAPLRLTFLKGQNLWQVWTPDGTHIVFRSEDPGAPGLYWVRSDGAGEPVRLAEAKLNERPMSFAPDGKRLAFDYRGNGGSSDIGTALIEGDREHPKMGSPEPFLATPADESSPQFSPDGRWLAYESTETGTRQLYVRPFPGPGGRWQISTRFGHQPTWSRTSSELFFRGRGDQLVANYTVKANTFVPDAPREWTSARFTMLDSPFVTVTDMAPDGSRIATVGYKESGDPGPQTHLMFLMQFFDELHRRAPLPR